MFDLIQLWLFIVIVLSIISVIAGVGGLITLDNYYRKGLYKSPNIEVHDYWWATSLSLLLFVCIVYGLVWLAA